MEILIDIIVFFYPGMFLTLFQPLQYNMSSGIVDDEEQMNKTEKHQSPWRN